MGEKKLYLGLFSFLVVVDTCNATILYESWAAHHGCYSLTIFNTCYAVAISLMSYSDLQLKLIGKYSEFCLPSEHDSSIMRLQTQIYHPIDLHTKSLCGLKVLEEILTC